MTTCPKCSRPVSLDRDRYGWHMDCFNCGQTAYGSSEENLREVIEQKRRLYHPDQFAEVSKLVLEPAINTPESAEKSKKVQLKPGKSAPESIKKERKTMPFKKKTEKIEPKTPEIREKSAKIEVNQPQKPVLTPAEMRQRAADIRANIESAYKMDMESVISSVYKEDGPEGVERLAFGAGSKDPIGWAKDKIRQLKSRPLSPQEQKTENVSLFFSLVNKLSLDDMDDCPEEIFQPFRQLKRAVKDYVYGK